VGYAALMSYYHRFILFSLIFSWPTVLCLTILFAAHLIILLKGCLRVPGHVRNSKYLPRWRSVSFGKASPLSCTHLSLAKINRRDHYDYSLMRVLNMQFKWYQLICKACMYKARYEWRLIIPRTRRTKDIYYCQALVTRHGVWIDNCIYCTRMNRSYKQL
jgi:hypothetical protein